VSALAALWKFQLNLEAGSRLLMTAKSPLRAVVMGGFGDVRSRRHGWACSYRA
jgi:hypothetical protein